MRRMSTLEVGRAVNSSVRSDHPLVSTGGKLDLAIDVEQDEDFQDARSVLSPSNGNSGKKSATTPRYGKSASRKANTPGKKAITPGKKSLTGTPPYGGNYKSQQSTPVR
mmetsp:Transcript_20307/g.48037  ORF Transcript_20307/g.48037 Transcript_20307/m.48037 type:complete len:109 (-) Transcript_20307:366-692(-)